MEEKDWDDLPMWLKLAVGTFAVFTVILVILAINTLIQLISSSNLIDLVIAVTWLFLAILSAWVSYGLYRGNGYARYTALVLALMLTYILFPFGIVLSFLPLYALLVDRKTIKYFQ